MPVFTLLSHRNNIVNLSAYTHNSDQLGRLIERSATDTQLLHFPIVSYANRLIKDWLMGPFIYYTYMSLYRLSIFNIYRLCMRNRKK